MVFGSKPKKMKSLKPGDKRRISLLNSDVNTLTGLEASMFGDTATHTLSPLQLVAGSEYTMESILPEMPSIRQGSQEMDLVYLTWTFWLGLTGW